MCVEPTWDKNRYQTKWSPMGHNEKKYKIACFVVKPRNFFGDIRCVPSKVRKSLQIIEALPANFSKLRKIQFAFTQKIFDSRKKHSKYSNRK